MLEKNLWEHGMGLEKISEADYLVFLDDEILVSRYSEKGNRAERRRNSKKAKNHRQELSKYSYAEIRVNSGKIVDWSDKAYFRGCKMTYSRPHNYKWETEDVPNIVEEEAPFHYSLSH